MNQPEAAQQADPLVAELRQQITDNDLAILRAINTRIELVARLRRHKVARGYPFVDATREEWLFRFLDEANPGPLSNEGLRELYAQILELTKREVGRGETAG